MPAPALRARHAPASRISSTRSASFSSTSNRAGYDADVAPVVGDAQAWLERRAPQVGKPAIVLDIDETSLSNWPAYKINGWGRVVGGDCNLEQGPCGLRAWQGLGRSPAIAPTLGLVSRAPLPNPVYFLP
jgi:hypothetical protein